MYEKFTNFIENKKHICVIQAENPDGDSLGSALALEQALTGKEITLYCPVDIPKYMRYAAIRNCLYTSPVLVIDHHETAPDLDFGHEEIIETSSSCCALLYKIFKDQKISVNEQCAENLLYGILSDTLGLTSQSATSEDYRTSADLIDLGAHIADMEERRQLLGQRLQEQSFVKDWERVTGYTWHRGDYHWLLYRAGQKGPSYNNLNDSTNTVWYNQDIDYQLAMFSHEFGIFLMQDSIDPIVEEMKVYTRKLDSDRDLTYVPWSAFESLACWYNCKIAGHETADYRAFGEADVQTFCQIFDRLSKEGISNPAELYRKGVKEYLKQLLWQ